MINLFFMGTDGEQNDRVSEYEKEEIEQKEEEDNYVMFANQRRYTNQTLKVPTKEH